MKIFLQCKMIAKSDLMSMYTDVYILEKYLII